MVLIYLNTYKLLVLGSKKLKLCTLLKAFLACSKASELFESAFGGRLFATEHLKGWKPFNPVIDSGRSDLFLHTTHPFFILHFLRAADLSEKVF